MEYQLWKSIVALVTTLDKVHQLGCDYSDGRIVSVWFWSVIHDRPVCWACE